MTANWQPLTPWWKRGTRFLAVKFRYLALQLRRRWLCLRRTTHHGGAAVVSTSPVGDVNQQDGDSRTTAPADARPTLVKGAFRDRRTTLFTVATATGMLALLLMLGWQVSQFLSDPWTLRDDDVTASSAVPDTNDGQKLVPVENSTAGAPTDRRRAADFQPILKRMPEPASPFLDTAHGAPHRSGTVDDVVTKSNEPPESPRSPFDQPALEPQPQFEKRDRSSKIETPTVAARSGAAAPDHDKASDAAPLGLEIVRTAVSQGAQPDPRFLATSIAPGTRAAKRDAVPDVDGWQATREPPADPPIIRARHGRTSPAGVPVTSSASSRWTVAAPKLTLQIVLPRRISVGQRVPIRLRIVNVGTATAAPVTLHVDLPPELSYRLGNRLSHEVGELPPGKLHETRLTPTAVRTGDVTVSATAFCKENRASSKTSRTVRGAGR